MAYPTFVAAGAAISIPGNGSTAAVAVPAGVASGDLLLCVMLLGNGNGNTATGPSGFTAIDSQAATTFSAGLRLYYKIAGGSEPGTYNVSQSGANLGAARMYAWTGVHASTPINVNTKSSVLNGVTTINLPSATTTVAECLHVGVSFEYNGRTPTVSATGSQTARGGSTLSGRVFQVTEEQIAAAGAVTGKTHSSGTSGDFYAFSIGIAPTGVTTITGTLATTEPADTASFSGDVFVTGTAAATEATDTFAATGGTVTFGTMAVTEAPDIFSALGGGRLATTEAADTAAFAGGVRWYGIVGDELKNPSGTLLADTLIQKVAFVRVSDMVVVLSLTNQTTDEDGLLPVYDSALANGTSYIRLLSDATGANVGAKTFAAA